MTQNNSITGIVLHELVYAQINIAAVMIVWYVFRMDGLIEPAQETEEEFMIIEND